MEVSLKYFCTLSQIYTFKQDYTYSFDNIIIIILGNETKQFLEGKHIMKGISGDVNIKGVTV